VFRILRSGWRQGAWRVLILLTLLTGCPAPRPAIPALVRPGDTAKPHRPRRARVVRARRSPLQPMASTSRKSRVCSTVAAGSGDQEQPRRICGSRRRGRSLSGIIVPDGNEVEPQDWPEPSGHGGQRRQASGSCPRPTAARNAPQCFARAHLHGPDKRPWHDDANRCRPQAGNGGSSSKPEEMTSASFPLAWEGGGGNAF
jgi:hypothetical protein